MSEDQIYHLEQTSDAALVAACLDGKRDAYAQIVERYQRLLCSLAYSSVGSLSESEDLAQEAFIEGWRKLSTLKSPEKLRSWLCGILRFKISHRVRKYSRDPSQRAGSLDEAEEMVSNDEPTEEQTMRDEEKALLWDALKQVPQNYREPLVLFYREHKSIEHVASELDLSEDAVKQRLSRGRKMLQERMMSFVEDALSRSAPGKVFTMGVMAALPLVAPPAKAIALGSAVTKVGSATKTAGLAAILASVSGLVSSFFMIRANLDQARTKNERWNVVKSTAVLLGIPIGLVAAVALLMFAALNWADSAVYLTVASQLLVAVFVLWYPFVFSDRLRKDRQLRAQERLRKPDAFRDPVDQVGSKSREYKSGASFLGIPLVHIQFSMIDESEKPAFGWIAFGNKAYGVLFALGGQAMGTISVGLVSCGLITCSVVGVGVIGMGTVGIGLIGIGAVAIGFKAFSSLSSLGWDSAFGGGFAVAREAAVGRIAFAKEANTELAAQMTSLPAVEQHHVWVLFAMAALVLIPVISYAQAIKKRMARTKD